MPGGGSSSQGGGGSTSSAPGESSGRKSHEVNNLEESDEESEYKPGDTEEGEEDSSDEEPRNKRMRLVSPEMIKPPDAEHIVHSRIASFEVPQGFKLVPVPDDQARRSIIYKYGVKLIPVEDMKTMQGKGKARKASFNKTVTYTWHCLATKDCVTDGFSCKIKGNRSSNATEHLKLFHTTVSEKTKKKEVIIIVVIHPH